jgi:hypothetical protein
MKIDIFINYQLQIKDKIYLKLDRKLATIVAVDKLAETALLELIWVTGDGLTACSATKNDFGDRETIPDQGRAVVPADGVATHEIERPETH